MGESITTVGSRDNIFCEGDVIATIIEPGDPRYKQLNPRLEEMTVDYRNSQSEHVLYDESKKQFIAKMYGFVKIADNRTIDIFPLIEIDPDAMKGYVYIFPNSKNKFSNNPRITKNHIS